MARFTIQLPAELAGDTTGTGADGPGRCETRTDGGDRDAATRGFVSWVECWADA